MLTVAQIRKLQPGAKRYIVTDGAGLELEVFPTGMKSWRLRYRLGGRQNRVNLGRWPGVSLAEAREKRDKLIGQVKAGVAPASPKARKGRKAVTLREFAERYLEDVASKARKNLKPLRRYLDREVYPSLGSMPLQAVTVGHLRGLIFAKRDAGSPQAALALRDLLKRIFDYAEACEACPGNPARAVARKFVARANKRERALSEREIGVFLRRLPGASIDERHKIALRLILLTLVRKSELRLARWEHVDLDGGQWEIPPEMTKTGKGHIVYLSSQARECFAALRRLNPRSPLVMPADGSTLWPIAAGTLNRCLNVAHKGMPHFTVHDLRRTAATRLAEIGYDADVIEKCLNHSIKGVRGIYNRAQYAEQRRTMLQEWGDELDRVTSSRGQVQA